MKSEDKFLWETIEYFSNLLLKNDPPMKIIIEQTNEEKGLAESMKVILETMYKTRLGKKDGF